VSEAKGMIYILEERANDPRRITRRSEPKSLSDNETERATKYDPHGERASYGPQINKGIERGRLSNMDMERANVEEQ